MVLNFNEFEDWQSLGALINVPTNLMAYALQHREELQKHYFIKTRHICASYGSLKEIQKGISLQMSTLFESLDNTEYAIAYRPGFKATDYLKELVGYDYLISFDIKKYFDNITRDHIVHSLTNCGFSGRAANLVARYCCTKYRGREVMQQGSAASPALSNIVGRHYFDIPIKEQVLPLLGNMDVRYVRYCDNMAFFINGYVDKELYNKINDAITNITINNGFDTHDWKFVKHDSNSTHMFFLGVVLNSIARLEKFKIDNYRAWFFSAALNGLTTTYEHHMLSIRNTKDPVRRVVAKMQGIVNYVRSINERHALWLEKLLEVAKNRRILTVTRENLLKYKDDSQSVKDFLAMFL